MSEFSRRIFLRGAALTVAAPAIVRADSLMNIFVAEDPFEIAVYDVIPRGDASVKELVYSGGGGKVNKYSVAVSGTIAMNGGRQSEMDYQLDRGSRQLTMHYLYHDKGIRDMNHINHLINTRYTPDNVLRFV